MITNYKFKTILNNVLRSLGCLESGIEIDTVKFFHAINAEK